MIDVQFPDTLNPASYSDWCQLADITAEAFAEDPVNIWVFGNPRAIRSAFRVLASDIYARRGLCYLTGDNGAAMWAAHDTNTSLSALARLRLAAGLLRYASKGALKRAAAVGKIMAENHPKDPHMYLFTIGVRKSARGTGLGKALLAPVLSACDRDRVPAYLENSNPANHGFYAAHGFERTKLFDCGKGGPPMEGMWREPRS